jgi:phenylacetate-coenzyme A ligase PaaK-like adenylate-forming protein
MPLCDHFLPPASKSASWEAVHGGWPMMIVRSLAQPLPQRYVAHPRVNVYSEYEVRVYDTERNQRLVAAVELVSPANKDRPEHRQTFVAKCAALLQNQVSVTIVDVVTVRAFNLYGELLDLIG